MGRTNMGRARSGVAGVVCILAFGHAAEAQRPSGPPRQALTYDQAFGTSAYGGREQPAVLADVPTVGEWVDATHYLETRRERRRPAARLRDLGRRRHVAARRAGRRLGRDRARRGVPRRAAG